MSRGQEEAVEAHRQMLLAQEKAREERVESMAKRAARSIFSQELVGRGGGWYETWSEKVRTERMLRGAGARLTKPALVRCVAFWRHDWEVARQEEAEAKLGRAASEAAAFEERLREAKVEWERSLAAERAEAAKQMRVMEE